MNVRVQIIVHGLDGERVRARLTALHGLDEGAINVEESPRRAIRSLDPAVLVAVVGAAGTALGSLVTSLLTLARERKARTISVTSGGTTVSMREDASLEQIQRILEVIRDHQGARIVIDPNA